MSTHVVNDAMDKWSMALGACISEDMKYKTVQMFALGLSHAQLMERHTNELYLQQHTNCCHNRAYDKHSMNNTPMNSFMIVVCDTFLLASYIRDIHSKHVKELYR